MAREKHQPGQRCRGESGEQRGGRCEDTEMGTGKDRHWSRGSRREKSEDKVVKILRDVWEMGCVRR